MKKWIILLMMLSYGQNILCAPLVLYFAPEVSSKERRSFLNISENHFMNFSESYLATVPAVKNIEMLTGEFEQAQKYYLVHAHNLAQEHYQKVIAMQDMDDWRDLQRKMIFLSFVRLAELDSSSQQDYLKKAVAFSPDDVASDYDLSATLTQKLKAKKEEINSSAILWSVQSLQKDFSYVLINGHVIDLKKFENIKIPPGSYRITYLSDIYKPQNYKVTSQQIPLIEPSRIPFVSGNCEHPQWNREGEGVDELAVYYSEKCVQYLRKNNWSLNADVKNFSTASAVNASEENLQNVIHKSSSYEASENPFYKKKWFWIAAGSLVAGYLIYAASPKKTSRPAQRTVTDF